MPEELVIIVAGGTGSRMKNDRPKQFLELAGLPIIIHTIKRFLAYKPAIQIIIAVHKEYLGFLNELLITHHLTTSITVTEGGPTRFDSVYNGLKQIKNPDTLVAIHDAARPLVSTQTIQRCFDSAALNGSGVPVINVSDSLRQLSPQGNKAVNRAVYKVVQTPQCFRYTLLMNAFALGYQESFTDDATVVEAAGHAIHLVDGNEENIKITCPHDLLLAAALLTNTIENHAE